MLTCITLPTEQKLLGLSANLLERATGYLKSFKEILLSRYGAYIVENSASAIAEDGALTSLALFICLFAAEKALTQEEHSFAF